MPRSGVRLPSGQVVIVEHEAGATPEQIKALAAKKGTAAPTVEGYPVVPPETENLVKPSAGAYVAEGAKKRAGDIGAMIGATVAPGKGALGLGTRLLGAEAGEDLGQAATGEKITPGFGAASQLVGEGVTKAVAPLVSPATYRAFANRTVKTLGEKLRQMVPAWESLPATHQGLYEMAHGTGQRRLSGEFADALQKIAPKVKGATVWMRDYDLDALGLKAETFRQVPTAASGPAPVITEGEVLLTDAIQAVTGRSQTDPGLYRRAVRQITKELDVRDLGQEYSKAREAYKVGAGFIEIAEKGKFLYGEHYDPARAQASLDRFGKSLLGRGMDEIRAIIRGPGDKPIEPVKHTPWVQRLEGSLVGAAAGTPFGVPHAVGGAAGGLAASTMLPRTTYKNVPLTPAAQWAGKLAPVTVGEGAREAARQLNVPEGVYGP